MSTKDGARLALDPAIVRDDVKVPVLLVDDAPANLLGAHCHAVL